MTDKTFLTDLIAKLSAIGDVTVRPMMGEYLLYLNGRYVAVICDNALFVKSNKQNAESVANLPSRPPYEGAKPCFVVPTDDVAFLREVVHSTYLGAPERKNKK
ncbi:MAG: TfoX/Sxy family protein [Corallococcus sp.]|nr:TfoX/Sxy family protein [Corallococcus sp.]MCM1359134.1 TfoX/Sxy family protein [Corallococcus sp.]MCM1394524.1 TfoX/Sxy family protein [Corallococcus sp.]